MKLPAVAIATAFAGGIVLGRQSFFTAPASLPFALRVLLPGALLAFLAGVWLLRKNHLRAAAAAALVFWLALGTISARVAYQPLPAEHLLSLLDARRLDLATPLRWQGRLRDEPHPLPWGLGMDVDLTGVEFNGAALPVTGGMRLTYAAEAAAGAPLPELHAGDEVAFTAKARLPALFRDDGAFNRPAYLGQQNIHLTANLRAAELAQRVAPAPESLRYALARVRAHLRATLDALFPAAPESAAILRAMLLGDRSFVERAESKSFQITGTYHVLVVAGLHVTALAVFLFWAGRALRLPRTLVSLLALALLLAYVGVVEQRPPVVRAALMAAVVVLGSMLYRRLDLLNSAALAALLILVARPLELFDPSFQLSFLAMGCIGGLAVPWLGRSVEPYARALRGWRDVTRDAAHAPRQAQFRIDLRSLDRWIAQRLPEKTARWGGAAAASLLSFSFRAWEIFLLSLVLQIGMLPMMALQFHRIALSGPLANLFAVPLTGVIVPLGFLTLGTAAVFHPLGQVLALPLSWLTALLTHVAGWFSRLPHGSYRIPGPPWWLLLLFFAAFAGLAAALRRDAEELTALRSQLKLTASRSHSAAPPRNVRRTTLLFTAALLACAAVIALYPFAPRTIPGKLEVTALDVAQGDALLVVSPHGRTMLIDGGGAFAGYGQPERRERSDPGEEVVSPYLWSRGLQRLDIVALTHAHQDHIGGLAAILENFRVGRLWIGREVASPAQAALEELARSKGIPIEHERRGGAWDWDGVRMRVLWPEIAAEETAPGPKNNDSLVLRLAFGRRVILLPGDIEKQAEREIAAETPEDGLRADVLKVGHHGSKNSTMEEFLARVRPRIAVVSAGAENPYGHPSPEALERLEQAGVRVLRTDRSGAIHILTDGESVEIYCYTQCAAQEPQRASGEPHGPEQDEQSQN
ncbi:MAG: DNA internalization-related competence protein ComEC/Rec2 [Acidobacteriia bacterium]|nr:DNA internalization-related competence protein ComEC/Rec2 [Terriglobia bacterium]